MTSAVNISVGYRGYALSTVSYGAMMMSMAYYVHPDAYREQGAGALLAGKTELDNPYEEGTSAAAAWLEGFSYAEDVVAQAGRRAAGQMFSNGRLDGQELAEIARRNRRVN